MIAEIIENNKLTENIFQLKCRADDYNGFTFEPGQYIVVKIVVGDREIRRAYSFSSLPKELPFFDLTIRRHLDGKVSPILTDLRVGEKFNFLDPMGLFHWKMVKNKRIVLVAIGCGIAPIKSMIEAWLENPDFGYDLTLFFGNRFFDQVPYQDYFLELAKKNTNFHYFSCISRLEGLKDGFFFGRVNDVMLREIDRYYDTDFVVCGSDDMIKGMKLFLEQKGVRSNNIYYENVLA